MFKIPRCVWLECIISRLCYVDRMALLFTCNFFRNIYKTSRGEKLLDFGSILTKVLSDYVINVDLLMDSFKDDAIGGPIISYCLFYPEEVYRPPKSMVIYTSGMTAELMMMSPFPGKTHISISKYTSEFYRFNNMVAFFCFSFTNKKSIGITVNKLKKDNFMEHAESLTDDKMQHIIFYEGRICTRSWYSIFYRNEEFEEQNIYTDYCPNDDIY